MIQDLFLDRSGGERARREDRKLRVYDFPFKKNVGRENYECLCIQNPSELSPTSYLLLHFPTPVTQMLSLLKPSLCVQTILNDQKFLSLLFHQIKLYMIKISQKC